MLPNKTVALVLAALPTDDLTIRAQIQAVKAGRQYRFDFETVSATLEGIAKAIRSGLATAGSARTTVEFGIELAVKDGKLTGMLVDDHANASLKVTLEWGGDQAGGAESS